MCGVGYLYVCCSKVMAGFAGKLYPGFMNRKSVEARDSLCVADQHENRILFLFYSHFHHI